MFIATLLMAMTSINMQAQETTYDVVKSYDFTTLTNKEAFTSSGTRSVNGTNCEMGIDKFEGLATQGSGNWFGYNTSGVGLRNNNSGGRIFAVLDMKKGYLIKITATTSGNLTLATESVAELTNTEVSATNSAATVYTYTMTADGDLGCSLVRYNNIYAVEVLKEHVEGICENPEYKITAPVGTKRNFTLSCLTEDATIYYSEEQLTANDEGWKEYTSEVTTEAETIHAYAKTADATSEVISFATGAGTSIKLNTPGLTKTAYNNGMYTVSFSADQSNLSPAPTEFNYVYSIDGGAEQSYANSVQVAAGSTVSVYTKAEGYDNSDLVEIKTAIRPTHLTEIWSQDYTKLTTANGHDAMQVKLNDVENFVVGETSFYNITGYIYNNESHDITVTPYVGLNNDKNIYLRDNGNNSGILNNHNTNSYIGINKLNPGDVIIITTNSNPVEASMGVTFEKEMSLSNEYYFTATGTEASIYFEKGTYNYIQTIAVNRAPVIVSIPNEYNTYCTPSALDFTDNADVKAYAATVDEENNRVVLTEVMQVPAGEGVVLKNISNATSATVNVIATAASIADNAMVGVTEAMDAEALVADNAYILNANNKFHRVGSGATNQLAAGKAYLRYKATEGSEARLTIVIEDSVTAVADVTAPTSECGNVIYNLQGVRVQNITAPGLYIVNGKTVVVK